MLPVSVHVPVEGLYSSALLMTAADEAELQMLVPPDVPTPKPWKLKRVSTN
jgi:hypothetical protein